MIVTKKEEKSKDKKKSAEEEVKEPQYYRSATGEKTLNYRVYYMSAIEKIGYFLLGFAVGAMVGFLFYGGLAKDEYDDPTLATYILNILIMSVCGFGAGKMFLPIRNKQLLENRQRKLKTQFRDMLEALTTSLGAGSNIRDAFASVYDDMKNQYEEDAFIINELYLINTGLMNGVNLEDLLADFGRRSGCDDIQDFAEVFEICYRQGGNIKETVRNTAEIIGDKMSVAEEIETTVAGSKNEQYIMLIMPVLLVGMIKVSSPDFASNFATTSGVMATTVGIILFVASFFLGKKLLDIKI
jgi:tight adherence protein B